LSSKFAGFGRSRLQRVFKRVDKRLTLTDTTIQAQSQPRDVLNSSLCEGRPMAHQWPSFPRPESPETSFAPRLDAKKPGSPARPPESEALRLLYTLRDAVTAGGLDLDAQLHEITETAQKLTDASAAALAVRSHGVVICRARVGETAPAIGAKVVGRHSFDCGTNRGTIAL